MNKFLKSSLVSLLLMNSTYALAAETDSNRNLLLENANKEVVINLYELFFNKHKVAEASKLVSENYRQHNPYVPDGKNFRRIFLLFLQT